MFWKIDYYDQTLERWEDPMSSQCRRVLTVMLASSFKRFTYRLSEIRIGKVGQARRMVGRQMHKSQSLNTSNLLFDQIYKSEPVFRPAFVYLYQLNVTFGRPDARCFELFLIWIDQVMQKYQELK